jgi:DNA-binding transcriptional regulator GbsR (MarR family)
VLFIAAEPLPAATIGERLQMSAGAVSMSLTELSRWGVVKRVWRPGERKDYYEAETDFWKMISKVFDERERLLAESVQDRLQRAAALLRQSPLTASGRSLDRLSRLLAFVIVAQTALDGFIKSRRVDFTRFGDLVRFPLRAASRKKG